MQESTKAALLMAFTACIWGSGGLAIKLIDLHPMAITGVRSLLAACTLLLVLRGRARFTWSGPQIGAALGYAGLLISNVVATKLTTAANAILLAYTAPVYVAILAPLFLKESTRRSDWVFLAACLGGMFLFFLDRLSPSGLWGNILAMGTGMSYALFTLCMRAQKTSSPVESVILGHCITALAGVPFLLSGLPSATGWLGLLYLGIGQQGFSLLLYTWSIKRLGAMEAILIMTLEPICNPLLVALGYGELPGVWAISGGLVVVGSVTLRAALNAWSARTRIRQV